jgi:regulator of protease activity HflC (stomatin/prohibitin superfamily)
MDSLFFIIVVVYLIFIFPIIRKFNQVYKNKSSEQISLGSLISDVLNYYKRKGKKLIIFNSSVSNKNLENQQIFSSYKYNKFNFIKNMKNKIWWIIGGVVVIVILANTIVIVPAGHTGVRTLFGKVRDKEISAGMHLVNPLENIERMSIRTEEYTMSVSHGEGKRMGADQISALTNEGLPIDLDITVFYHLEENKASDVYKDLGINFQEKIIRPEIRSTIREVVARYNAKDVYSEKRAEVSDEIRKRMAQTINPRGIIVEQVLLRNVTLPPKLSASIQEKLQAEQDAQKYDFVLEKEKKEAERKRIEAEGQRDAQKIINESLTPKYLEYLYIRELKEREGTIYVPIGNNGLPLFKGIE